MQLQGYSRLVETKARTSSKGKVCKSIEIKMSHSRPMCFLIGSFWTVAEVQCHRLLLCWSDRKEQHGGGKSSGQPAAANTVSQLTGSCDATP